jgi:hypothetical protein
VDLLKPIRQQRIRPTLSTGNIRDADLMANATARKTIKIDLNPNGKGNRKPIGGAAHDEWNDRLTTLIAAALPINRESVEQCSEAATAVFSGMFDIQPSDPIEGILVGQLMVAHEAALSMYRRAWQQPAEYFEARTKYLALADKAARTVALLSERLDQHRGRGQQQITVKHVTVNADQAVVADKVMTAGGGVRGGNDKQPHAQAAIAHAPGTPMPCALQENRETLPVTSDADGRCRIHGGKSPGPPKGNRHAWKHGGRSAETIQLRRAVNLLARLARGERL